jgi:hypothetical protein
MLGVCLLFVGIVLINNGMCGETDVYAVQSRWQIGGSDEFADRRPVGFYQFREPGTAQLLCGRNRTSVWIYLSVCRIQQDLQAQPDSVCMVFHLCCSQCTDLWNHRGNYRKCSTWNYRRYPLGRYLVSVGNPLGNCICRRYHGQKARKICTAASGV